MTGKFQSSTPKFAARILGGRMLGLLLVMALLAGMLPQVALAASPPSVTQTCSKYHTVASGDTLSSISVTYDISVAELAAANSLTEPYTLVIGQRLCIPGSVTTTPDSTSTTSTTETGFTVERQGNNLVITASNYPKKSNFYVKIKKGRLNSPEPWLKIGRLGLRKNTEVTKTFKLPKSFYDAPQFQVCLKNAKSDAISCQSFVQP